VKPVFVVTKVFVNAPTAAEVFTRVEKMFLQIFVLKPFILIYLAVLQPLVMREVVLVLVNYVYFLGVAKCGNQVKVNLLFRDFCCLLVFFIG
jgi:hypothetical protein